MSKSVKMLTSGTDKLEEILQLGQNAGNKHGLGYKAAKKPVGDKKKNRPGKSMSKKMSHHKTGISSGSGYVKAKKFVDNKKKNRPNKPMSKQMSQHWVQHQDQRNMNKKFQRWRCHYCGRFGHIKTFCFRLHGYPNQGPYEKPKTNRVAYTQQWKKKTVALVAHTSLRVSAKEDWYFDNGCSKHMTGDKNLLDDVKPHSTSFVTFGDGAKGEIKGVGNSNWSEVPNLNEVLLVKGLTANLISISQLCDMGFTVNFTKAECLVINDEQVLIMRGVRSKDNCYLWESENPTQPSVCSTDKDEEEVRLGQQESDHPHLKGMERISSKEGVRRVPRIHMEKGKICGNCKAGQEIRMSPSMSRHLITPEVLKQSTRFWHERLTKCLTVKGYRRGVLDEILFVRGANIMVASIYSNNLVSEEVSDTLMDGSTLPSQNKYARRIVKRIGMKNVRHKRTPAPTHLKLSKRTSGKSVDQSLCKRIFVGCVFLRNNLIPWINKKQNCVFLYNVEAELIAVDRNCSRMIWMKQMLAKYNVTQDVMTLSYDISSKVLEASQFKSLRDEL